MVNNKDLIKNIRKYSKTFTNINDLTPLLLEASQRNFVLLGEASHGTSEFYQVRKEITKKLLKEHHFSYIAVEGDWPSCFEVNRFIKGMAPEYKNARDVLKNAFNRWPTWMWANEEIEVLIDWLYHYNQSTVNKVGFYGLDVYSLWESMEAIIDYLKKINSEDLDKALQAIECFDPYNRKPQDYGISAVFHGTDCIEEIIELLNSLHKNPKKYDDFEEAELNMKVNSIVISNGEHYYHTMVTDDNESWNIRDEHMVEALSYIAEFYGNDHKGIIWEHNTHIGDARATDMVKEGLVNVGQLMREKFGYDQVFSIGFGTYQGTVIASYQWAARHIVMNIPEGMTGSFEEALHIANPTNQYLLFNDDNENDFEEVIIHRAIGVVYDPQYEDYNYVPSIISKRYNGFIHIDKTTALKPLL